MIKSIHLKSYGQFDDLKLHFTSGINLIYAENEGGKTTLFSALESGLLGFIPAGANHPYFPWEGEELSLELKLSDGRTILRKLRGSISGYLEEEGKMTTLANQPLEGLSRQYFRDFHLLEAEDLLSLEKKSMDQVLEMHLQSLYSGGGMSPKAMMKLLEEKRSNLYKKRGTNYQLYAIEQGLADYRKEELAYDEKEKQVEGIKQELDRVEEKLQSFPQDEEKPFYPELAEKISREDLQRIKELHQEELNIKKREEEIHGKLAEVSGSIAGSPRIRIQKAYGLEDRKQELQHQEEILMETLDELKNKIHRTLGMSSVDMEKLSQLKPFTYKGALFSFMLILLVGALGALLQQPAILSLLLPLLLSFYFFFQSWKNQLLEARMPGFFYGLKQLDDVVSLVKEREENVKEAQVIEEEREELRIKEQQFLQEEDIEGSMEDFLQEEEEKTLLVSTLLHEKEQLAREKEQLEQKWTEKVIINKGRQLDLHRLEQDVEAKENPSKVKELRDELLKRRAELDFDLQVLQRELENKPKGKDELLEKKALLIEEYNRALFLTALLDKGYTQYRDELYPTLLERTSSYLRAFTGGQYQSVMNSKENELYLLREDGVYPLRESMSKGLRSQFYLALRLALVELLGSDMPLVFDEAFSNWDESRLLPTLRKLQELPFQQFIFTCKKRDKDLFEEVLAVKAIEL